ncbi:pilus assembly PilX family protein [Allohahella marinimesophila]|uniref:Type 4 fimbrial biogenesis protein PilX N-terminal domain-containing protein n=1 Tax=Allohahella marinimesophila TaxID=1054972 RepID=A0ABP7NNM9_9GAMM
MTYRNVKLMKDIRRPAEQGVALIAALVMLLVMTVIAVLGMEETTLEERMLLNMRDKGMSVEAGESMLRRLERYLTAQVGNPPAKLVGDCALPPLCGGSEPVVWVEGEKDWETNLDDWTWWTNQAVGYDYTDPAIHVLAKVSQQPRGMLVYDGFDLGSEDLSFGVAVTDPQTAAAGVGPHYYSVVSTAAGLRSDNAETTEWREDTTSTVESRYVKIL